MPRFVSADDVRTIHAEWWDEDETVTIKKLTYGDRQTIGKAAARLHFDENGKPLDSELGDINLVTLEVGIRSWTFTRENGKPAPCNRFWFEKLAPEDGEFILGAINDFNAAPERSEAEQEEFRSSDRDGDPEGE